MKLYHLGRVSWADSQLLYHALPRIGREGLILLSPASPYVCIGYFQDVEQEVDLDYCREHGIPVFRREVGGGAVYLDGEQLFYQLILRKDNPLVPKDKAAFYRKFLQAPIAAYRALGIPAEYKPVNDIIANGRKISGNGVAEMGDFVVFVGNLIVDFDYETMVRVLRVPDEKFRDKVYKTLQENLSTIRRELGTAPPREELWSLLAGKFIEILGPLEVETTVDPEWQAEADRLAQRMLSGEWLYRRGRPQIGREITIRSGVQVWQKAYKAPGGLIRAVAEIHEGVIADLSISGDFFFYPAERLADLERALVGVRVEEVENVIARFYADHGVESPGLTPTDFATVLRG
ncbi:MAG: lipoate--protein ligase [Anaerolineae bacterium]|nr:lipoate--protein ligase [Anaerolineae bacterium]MDW8068170.1 lipoate--protein ligase [Anaerolineae bacterium]